MEPHVISFDIWSRFFTCYIIVPEKMRRVWTAQRASNQSSLYSNLFFVEGMNRIDSPIQQQKNLGNNSVHKSRKFKKKWIFKLLENEKEKKITSPRFFFLFFISFHFYFFVFVCAFKIYLLVALLSLFPFFFSFFLFWYNLFPASSPMKCHSTLLPRLCCCYIAKGDTRYILSSLVRPLILLSFRDAVVYILWSPHLRHPSPSSLFSLVRFGLWTLISSIRCDDASLIFSIKKRRRRRAKR